MVSSQPISCTSLFFCSFSLAFAEADFSKIEEGTLLNPPGSGNSSDKVIMRNVIKFM